ncbi:ATP-binding cassette domain-containing protein [Actinokineospora iranica]|uniref:ABC-2 type transport system ATP-binding protein n=1 Tax=Actinokineospora iranica TaxID=1271860 RepID=A0A1G6WKT6_9PSEU|nr:ATP-binding cassette domain-containing protein [Actinokineospora iranica]SDD66411.1 ABC-2 type transport system ATP-binding protein [Actinokineospora iranica]
MGASGDAVVVAGLRKRYGGKNGGGLDGVDLVVPHGTVCGLLGPNGAGKTTTVRILATLLRFDSGRALVAGFDVAERPDQVRARIGLVGQNPAVDEVLSGRRNLVLFGRLHHLGAAAARARAGDLLDRFGLSDAADKPVKHYSGGMRRRLDLAASMILSPAVLFLDEPTVGLDPRGRAEVWQAVRELVGRGTTVLLTTQHLDEADQLATRIALLDTGKVVAEGAPGELKARLGGDRVEFVVRDRSRVADAARAVARLGTAEPTADPDDRRVGVPVAAGATALVEAVRLLDAAGVAVDDLALRRPTLDEVFLHLTGRPADRVEVRK